MNRLRKLNEGLVLLAAFLMPTALGAFGPVSFNGQYSAGGVVLLLWAGLFVILMKSARIPRVKGLFTCAFYMIVQVVFLLLFMCKYSVFSDSLEYYNMLAAGVTNLVVISSVFLFVWYFTQYGTHLILISSRWFLCGIVVSACMSLLLFSLGFSFSSGGIYGVRNAIYGLYRMDPNVLVEQTGRAGKVAVRFMGASGGTASIGPFLVFCGAFSLGCCMFSRGGRRLVLCAITGICFVGAWGMASRSAMLSMLVIFFVGEVLAFVLKGAKTRDVCRFILVLVVMICAFVMIAPEYNVFTRMHRQDLAGNARLPLWKNGIHLFIENPLGYGYDYVRAVNMFGNGIFPGNINFEFNHLHNGYLATLVNSGVIGFLALIAVLVMSLSISLQNVKRLGRRESEDLRQLAGVSLGTALSIIAFMMHLIFASMFLTSEFVYGGCVWFLMAMAFSTRALIMKSPPGDLKRDACQSMVVG